MPILGIVASSFLQETGSFDFIQKQTVSGSSTNSITFSSLPTTYRHLQLRVMARNNRSSTNGPNWLSFNGDTSTNYRAPYLYSNGDATNTGSGMSTGDPGLGITAAGNTAGSFQFGVSTTTILDYRGSTFKSVLSTGGFNNQDTGDHLSAINSGIWLNTAAITSITFSAFTNPLIAGSVFVLYGIKG